MWLAVGVAWGTLVERVRKLVSTSVGRVAGVVATAKVVVVLLTASLLTAFVAVEPKTIGDGVIHTTSDSTNSVTKFVAQ